MVQYVNETLESYLKQIDAKFDVMYITYKS